MDVVVTRFANGNESGYEYRETKCATTIFGTYNSIDFEKRLYPVHNWVEHGMIACVWGKGYKRKIFDDLRFEGRYSEDDRFIDELNSRNYLIKVIDEIGYVYCYNPNSLIHNKDNQHRTDFLDILIRRLELFSDDSFIVENTSKLFCNLYIEYYYGIGKANRDLITEYMKGFNSCLKLLQTRKTDDKKFLLRMAIFRISPILYKTITSITSSIK